MIAITIYDLESYLLELAMDRARKMVNTTVLSGLKLLIFQVVDNIQSKDVALPDKANILLYKKLSVQLETQKILH